MAIRYYLQPYTLASSKKVFKARAVPQIIYDEKGIVDEMLQMGSTVTDADCQAVLTLFFDAVANKIAQGCHVNTRLFKVKPVMSGIFESPSDTFDTNRHTLKGSFSEGSVLRAIMAKATVEKTAKSAPMPLLEQFTDVSNGEFNKTLTPGSIGVINGAYLDFNLHNDEEGIYFSDENGQEIKVVLLADVTKKKIVFQIPVLATGVYTLKIRKDFGKTKKILRTGVLPHKLKID